MGKPVTPEDKIYGLIPKGSCLADRTLNYISQLQNHTKTQMEDEGKNYLKTIKMWNWVFEQYKNLRVDGYFSTHNPVTSAGALVYLGLKKFKLSQNGYNQCFTCRDIAEILNCTEYPLQSNAKKIALVLKL